ncbi:hypothetical protein MKX01_015326 [Papaver californicum]|nr:hypothetical protein MKX01_015326 [Papaver californicum]
MAGGMIVWVYDHLPTIQRCTKNSGYEEFHPQASLYVLNLSTQLERDLELELADLRERTT